MNPSAEDILKAACEPGVDLRGAHFRAAVDLSDALLGDVDLSGAVFEGPFLARRAQFTGTASLHSVTFCSEADFSGVRFASDLRLDGARFGGKAVFSRAEFHGIASFDGSSFDGPASLDGMVCLANLSLAGAVFRQTVTFAGTECFGGLWADHTSFSFGPDLTGLEIHGRTWFRGSMAGGVLLSSSLTDAVRRYGDLWMAEGGSRHEDRP